MKNNLGKTKLPMRHRRSDSLKDFDRLPRQLREWLRNAILPWSPKSVRRVYHRAFSNTGNIDTALAELERIQERQLAKDPQHYH